MTGFRPFTAGTAEKGSRRKRLWAGTVLICLLGAADVSRGAFFPKVPLPKLPPPELYGEVILDRQTKGTDAEPVYFSHWSHRLEYTCRVCHTELAFSFKADAEDIRMEDIRNGLFCGACHNGDIAFGPNESDKTSCPKCHGKSARPPKEKFAGVQAKLPAAAYGNRLDWGKAMDSGLTSPRNALQGYYRPMDLSTELVWTPPTTMVPKVRFPHKRHTIWLDCESCHPDIFDVKLQGTQRFSKRETLQGRFCGTCHLRVAFPFDDCTRCHINKLPRF